MFHPEPPRKDTVPPPDPEIADDRGETKYFHGREKEVGGFLKKLSESKDRKTGTIFLVQGPPGVGKTALLGECRKRAEKEGWSTADIRPGALWNNMILRECLGIARKRLKKLTVGASIEVMGLEVGLDFDSDASTPIQILQGKEAPLLLLLDEAQRLGDTRLIPDEKREAVTSILENIHNGKMDRPLVLLAGGLGNTLSSFHSLHISRFKNNCYFEMEALTKDEEQAVIRDWLVEEGKAKGDITEWADAISGETYGWGHHTISYIQPALDYLDENDGKMTEEGLRIVMEKGRANRWAYYTDRTEGLEDDHIVCLAEMFRDTPMGEGFRKQDLVAELGEPGFEQVVSKGVLYHSNPLYTIPIPSLYDYLTERAARIRAATLRYEQVKKRRQANHHPARDISVQQSESKDQSEPKPLSEADPENEGSRREPENRQSHPRKRGGERTHGT